MYPKNFYERPWSTAEPEPSPINKIMEKMRVAGSIDWRLADEGEKTKVIAAMENDFEAIDPSDRQELLEQLILAGRFDDAKVKSFAPRMTVGEQTALAEFIIKTIDDFKYLKTFYACWPNFDPEKQAAYLNKLTTSPDLRDAALIAPFTSSRSIIQRLMENRNAALAFTEALADLTEQAEPENSILKSQIKIVYDFWPAIFFKYPELAEKYLDEDEKQKLFSADWEALDKLLIAKGPDLTPEEYAQAEKIKERETKLLEAGNFLFNHDFFEGTEEIKRLRQQKIALKDLKNQRRVETLLGNFSQVRQYLKPSAKVWLTAVLQNDDLPIFWQSEQLALNPKDLIDVLNKSQMNENSPPFFLHDLADMIALLDFSRQNPASASLINKQLSEAIVKDLIGGEVSDFLLRLMINGEKIFPKLEEQNRAKVFHIMRREKPELLLLNLPLVLGNQVVAFEDLEKSVTHDPNFVVNYYQEILKQISRTFPDKSKRAAAKKQMKGWIKQTLSAQPEILFANEQKKSHLYQDNFSQEELAKLAEQVLKTRPVDKYALKAIIELQTDDKYQEPIRQAILACPDFLTSRDVFDPKILKYCAPQEIFPHLLDLICREGNDYLLNNKKLIIFLADYPDEAARFFTGLKQTGREILAASVLLTVQEITRQQNETASAKLRHNNNQLRQKLIGLNIKIKQATRYLATVPDYSKEFYSNQLREYFAERSKIIATLKERKNDLAEITALEKTDDSTDSENLMAFLRQQLEKKYQQKKDLRQQRKNAKTANQKQTLAKKLDKLNDEIAKLNTDYDTAKKFLKKIQEKETLPPINPNALEGLFAAAQNFLIEACQENPPLVFNQNILRLEHPKISRLVQENIETYAETQPEILLNYSQYSSLSGHLPKDLWLKLLEKHLTYLAFFRDSRDVVRCLRESGPEIQKQARALNPFLKLAEYPLPVSERHQELYAAYLEIAAGQPFFPLYEKRLKKIAARENEIHGPLPVEQGREINPDFADLIKRLTLLSLSPTASRNRDCFLASSPTEENEKILTQLEFMTRNDLDQPPGLDLSPNVQAAGLAEMRQKLSIFISKMFGQTLDENFVARYSPDTIIALSVYNRRESDKEAVQALRNFLKNVAAANYSTWRAWDTADEPATETEKEKQLAELKKQKLLPANLTLAEYTGWIEEDNLDLEAALSVEANDIKHAIKNIIELAVHDGHIPAENIQGRAELWELQYRQLMRPLNDLMEPLQTLEKKFAEARLARKDGRPAENPLTAEDESRHRLLKKEVGEYRQQNETALGQLEALLYLEKLQQISLKEIKDSRLEVNKKEVALDKVFQTIKKYFAEWPEFLRDVGNIQQFIHDGRRQLFGKKSGLGKTKFTVTDRIDLGVYVMIGKKPVSSCQSYDGGSYNDGLLSYLADPAVKIIQVYNRPVVI